MKDMPHLVWAVPAVMLLAALAPLPYGYYTLLRLVVCVSAALLAYSAYREGGSLTPWALALGIVALLFNPIIPIHLTRAMWAPIDLASAGLLAAHWWFARRATA